MNFYFIALLTYFFQAESFIFEDEDSADWQLPAELPLHTLSKPGSSVTGSRGNLMIK
jgi:hypothetical protein